MISSIGTTTRRRRIRSIATVMLVGAAVAVQLGSAQVASAAAAGTSVNGSAGATAGARAVCITTDVYVTDNSAFGANNGGLIHVNKADGARNSLSENNNPVGTRELETPWGMTSDANGHLLVAEQAMVGVTPPGVIRVDPVTGARTTLSRNGSPAGGPAFNGPMDIAVAENGDIYVANTFGNNIIKVDPVTGARTVSYT